VFALAVTFFRSGNSALFEPPLLRPLLNTFLLSALPFIIAFLAARSFVRQGTRIFVLYGCGMVVFGMGSLLGGWGLLLYGEDVSVAAHNFGCFLGGLCHLVVVVFLILGPPAKPQPSLRHAALLCAAAYATFLIVIVVVSVLAIKGYLPIFIVRDRGLTSARLVILAASAIAYTLSAILVVALNIRTRMLFLILYACGLFLTAIGLGVLMNLGNVGSALSWTGRASQYVGSLYFGAAILVGIRETRLAGTSLPVYLGELFQSRLDDQVRARTRELVVLNTKLRWEAHERLLAEEKLRESEMMYRSIIESSLQGVAIVREGRIVMCNEALCWMNGYSAEQIYRMTPEEVSATVHPQDRAVLRVAMETLEDPAQLQTQHTIRLLHKSGELRWVEMLGARSTYQGKPALQVSYVDITERRRAEAAYRSLIDYAPFGMAVMQRGRIVFVNTALAEISGYSADELLLLTPEQAASVIHSDDRERVLETMARHLAGQRAAPTQVFRFIRKDGNVRWVETQAIVIDYEGSPALQVSYKDATTELAAGEKLLNAHKTMRSLAAYLLHAREEERREVAREIHDELGQTLTALKMDLHWLMKRLGGDVPHLREKLSGTIELGEQAIDTVQRIAGDLRPKMLDDLGLEPALEWLGADFSRRTRIECKVSVDVPVGVIGGNAATTLYRIAQEALSNVKRHSRADRAVIRLFVSDGVLNLQVEDDGIGVTPEQVEAPGSYGLIGLHERVEGLGGSLSISGESGFGTILLARIPLPAEGGLA